MSISPTERETMKQEILAEIRAEEDAKIKREAELRLQTELKAREEYLIQEKERKRVLEELKSKEEPWVDIRGMVPDPEHGVKIELDWNDAFVKYLRANGIDGPTDDIVVQRWLEAISTEISTDMAIDDAEKTLLEKSEFE